MTTGQVGEPCGLILPPVIFPVPGERFGELALQRLGDPTQDIGEPELRVDIVEPGGTDQPVHCSSPHAAATRAGEHPRVCRWEGGLLPSDGDERWSRRRQRVGGIGA